MLYAVITRAAGESYLDEHSDESVFDLSGLEECNSAAVALMMAWVRYAHVHGKSVVYSGVRITSYNVCYTKLLRVRLPGSTVAPTKLIFPR